MRALALRFKVVSSSKVTPSDEPAVCRPTVAHRARRARILPDKLTELGRHRLLGLPRNGFDDLAAAHHDAHPRRLLGDRRGGFARLQREPPDPDAVVVHDLLV